MINYILHLNYHLTVNDDVDIDNLAEELQVALARLGIVVELDDISVDEHGDEQDDRFHSGTGKSIDDESYEQYLNGPSNPL
jgi:hypothetical protein